MSDDKTSPGVSPLWAAVLALAALKLGGAISMSWLWVFAPICIPLGFTLCLVGVYLVMAGITLLLAWVSGR